MGGKFDKIKWEPLELYIDNKPNKKMVAVLSALEQKIYNIPDIYKDTQFDFSGAKKFDKQTGYLSKSMIVIPLVDYQNETIGILQLLNKKDKDFVIPFNEEDEEISLSLASEAAVYITKNKLIQDLENFIESFIRVIANAVDEKSKYTGHHVKKVAILAEIISKEISKDKDFFPDVTYDERMLKQIKIAALLHDIGKITTNPTIMDKATKLQAVVDRIEIIKERFEIIKRDLLLKGINDFSELKKDFEILKLANIGSEFMSDEKIKQIEQIAKKYTYYLDDKKVNILRDDELEMLKIQKGTLSKEEREHIQRHALMTYEMLNALPFPKEYSEVTHIASNHHEKLNGKGYARKLSEKDLSLEDKLLVICDIFEALTASDRPYKEAKKLSEVFKIMEYMVKDKEIDEKLYRFFKEKEIWKKYLDYISPEQIDI
jgi:HD-GYP domain-containing protein (c-di-GMP phosphodiesterase class II)